MSSLQNPKNQAFLLVVLTMILYGILVRPVETINDMEIVDGYAYLAAGVSGIRILDVNDPAAIFETAPKVKAGRANAITFSEGRLYVAAGKTGVLIFKFIEPGKLEQIGVIDTPGNALDVEVRGNYVYVADGKAGIQIYLIKNLAEIKGVGSAGVRRDALDLQLQGDRLYAGDSGGYFHIFQIKGQDKLEEVNNYLLNRPVRQVIVRDNLVYLAAAQRGLVVLDIHDEKEIKELGNFATGKVASGVALESSYAYLADGRGGLQVVDITDPKDLRQATEWKLPRDAKSVLVRGNYVFIANGYQGVRVVKVEVPLKAELSGAFDPEMNILDVAKQGNLVYVAAGKRGLRVFDVSKPSEPREAGLIDLPGNARAVDVQGEQVFIAAEDSFWMAEVGQIGNEEALTKIPTGDGRPMGIAVDGNYVYLAAGPVGLQVYDITNRAEVVARKAEDLEYDALDVAVIFPYAYVATGRGGLQMVNIADPEAPVKQGKDISTAGDLQGVVALRVQKNKDNVYRFGVDAKEKDTQVYLFLAEGNAGFRIVDVSDVNRPLDVGRLRVQGFVNGVYVRGNRAYLAVNENGVKVVDLQNPFQPREIASFDTSGHARRLLVDTVNKDQQNYAFVADSDHGLRILNLDAPGGIREVGSYQFPAAVENLSLAGDHLLTVDGVQGLFIFDVKDASAPRELGVYRSGGNPQGLLIENDKAFLANGLSGVDYIDFSDPKQPKRIGALDTPGMANDLLHIGDLVYVADGPSGVTVADFSNPAKPRLLGNHESRGNALAIDRYRENYLVVANGVNGLYFTRLLEPGVFEDVNWYTGIGEVNDLVISGRYAYLAAGANGFIILDIERPLRPREVFRHDTGGSAMGVSLLLNYAFVADASGGVLVFDVSNPEQVTFQTIVEGSPAPFAAAAVASMRMPEKKEQTVEYPVFVASREKGIQVLTFKKSPSVAGQAIYDNPGTAPFDYLVQFFWGRIMRTWEGDVPVKIKNTLVMFVFDWVIIGLLGMFFWLFFVAQVALPSETITERTNTLSRLVFFLIGAHGPAVAIHDGKVIQGDADRTRRGAGVVITDLASAAVLVKRPMSYPMLVSGILKMFSFLRRDKSPFGTDDSGKPYPPARVIGPGITFTLYRGIPHIRRFDEVVYKAVDLRKQIRLVQALGATRDGIKVKCMVFALFTLSEQPPVIEVTYKQGVRSPENLRVIYTGDKVEQDLSTGRQRKVKFVSELSDELDADDRQEIHNYVQANFGKLDASQPARAKPAKSPGTPYIAAPYSYTPERITAAVYSEALQDEKRVRMDWSELPAQVAVDVFHEIIAHYSYDGIFEPGTPEKYKLPEVKSEFARRLRNQGVLSFKYVERKDGWPIVEGQHWVQDDLAPLPAQPLSQAKVLRARGIKIIHAGFSELVPTNEGVRKQLFEFWAAKWQQKADNILADSELEALQVRNQARIQTQRQMVQTFAQILGSGDGTEEALALRVFQALENVAGDPNTRRMVPSEAISMLRNLRVLLLPELGDEDDFPVLGSGDNQGGKP